MEILDLETIRKQLDDRSLYKVSDRTGIHYNTLLKIRDGENANPSYKTVLTLSKYLGGAQ